MKKIYFIRHAKSSWKEPYESDFERVLNKRGCHDAPMMAKRLKLANIFPDIIISSPATRAKKTVTKIAEILEYDKETIIYQDEFYGGGYKSYIETIKMIDNANNSVFIIGHNPAITEISEYIGDIILGNIPTCGIVCISLDIENFSHIKEKSGKVLFYDFPKSQSIPRYQ